MSVHHHRKPPPSHKTTSSGHHHKNPPKKKTNPTKTQAIEPKGHIPPPNLHYHYINFKGYGPLRKTGFSVLCGDDPPTIKGGYAKWDVIDRPLMRGVTVFRGYDPVTMEMSLRFGKWSRTEGWLIDNLTGKWVEEQIEKLEWMAGSNFVAGQSPYVYVNTFGPDGASTSLIPYEYQTTSGVQGSLADANLWPWIMGNGIDWGTSWRARPGKHGAGNRVYQECKVTLTSFQGLTKPPQAQSAGTYFHSTKGVNTMLLIAGHFHPLSIEQLANQIKNAHQNNPIPGTRISLKHHVLRWPIPEGKSVFVPGHSG